MYFSVVEPLTGGKRSFEETKRSYESLTEAEKRGVAQGVWTLVKVGLDIG